MPRNQNDREIGAVAAIDVSEWHNALIGHGGALDIERPVHQAEIDQHGANLVEVLAELHDSRRTRIREPPLRFVRAHDAGENGQCLIAIDQWRAQHGRSAKDGTDAGHDFRFILVCKPVVNIHERAIEKRITLRDHGDILTAIEMACYGVRYLAIEITDDLLVIHMCGEFFRRHRIDERYQNLFRRKIVLNDCKGVALLALGGVIGHDRRVFEKAERLQRYQFRVAGADTEAKQSAFCRHYSRSEASALTAAAVMALPPRLPRTIT